MYRRTHPDLPTDKTIARAFGSKASLLDQLARWAGSSDQYRDVAEILADQIVVAQKEAQTPAREGHVYLIRSGAHYKLGRSDELERRVKEIKVALPEAATLVHAIRTDDPAGIEAYWHRRFADRRANGEWFKLSVSDVTAFKRRKFQ
jgi:hypothetical protein